VGLPTTPARRGGLTFGQRLTAALVLMSSGTAWPSNDGPNALVLTGVSDGAAGIGLFFLRLNHFTRNPVYLGQAWRAADYIASTQHPSDAASELVQSPEFAAPFAS
jgi:hypothetical protein